MSGTSLDGLDGVLVCFDGNRIEILASAYQPYSPDFRAALADLLQAGENELARAAVLGSQHSELSAELVAELVQNIGSGQLVAIGSHGQTVRHAPGNEPPFTIQIGSGAVLAERTGVTTVCDFRGRDMAAGGEGAPLVPAFHADLFSEAGQGRAIVNIGGIANVTLLPGSERGKVSGFDTGPGNTLMDGWVRHHLDKPYDHDGEWARSGDINYDLLKQMRDDVYFSLSPPKSTGLEKFNQGWLRGFSQVAQLNPEDVQATLAALTAETIVSSVMQFSKETVDALYLCGGGARNRFLLELIAVNLPWEVHTTEALGIDPQLVEATAFAWLARQTMKGLPGNLPAVTGARSAVILGAIHPGDPFR